MELQIEIKFLCENHGFFGSAKKMFATNVIPYTGLKILDPAWENEKEIISVSVDFNNNIIYSELKNEVFFEKSMIAKLKETFKNAGWEIK